MLCLYGGVHGFTSCEHSTTTCPCWGQVLESVGYTPFINILTTCIKLSHPQAQSFPLHITPTLYTSVYVIDNTHTHTCYNILIKMGGGATKKQSSSSKKETQKLAKNVMLKQKLQCKSAKKVYKRIFNNS